MEATGTTTVKLKEPYMPTLRPRYVTDHPALRGGGASATSASSAAEEKGGASRAASRSGGGGAASMRR